MLNWKKAKVPSTRYDGIQWREVESNQHDTMEYNLRKQESPQHDTMEYNGREVESPQHYKNDIQ